ncbi:MAG: hypothetical protein EBX52_07050 [Proteobacteria bacterium]|nr:hypothetical protein [Pseudomonadota bacterium]
MHSPDPLLLKRASRIHRKKPKLAFPARGSSVKKNPRLENKHHASSRGPRSDRFVLFRASTLVDLTDLLANRHRWPDDFRKREASSGNPRSSALSSLFLEIMSLSLSEKAGKLHLSSSSLAVLPS